MPQMLFGAILCIGLLNGMANANGAPENAFVDGLWRGGVYTVSDSSVFKACWASRTFGDGTTLSLQKHRDGSWNLRLSNHEWQFQPSHQYEMTALVDFYPQQVQTAAATEGETTLKIADLDRTSLLGLIENGHTLELSSDGFNEKFDLEGSAKIIQRIRNCFTAATR